MHADISTKSLSPCTFALYRDVLFREVHLHFRAGRVNMNLCKHACSLARSRGSLGTWQTSEPLDWHWSHWSGRTANRGGKWLFSEGSKPDSGLPEGCLRFKYKCIQRKTGNSVTHGVLSVQIGALRAQIPTLSRPRLVSRLHVQKAVLRGCWRWHPGWRQGSRAPCEHTGLFGSRRPCCVNDDAASLGRGSGLEARERALGFALVGLSA
jgi:hypothetical protein